MLRRRGARSGPGLARTVATTAVVAGTATATSNAVNRSAMQRKSAAAQQAQERQTVADLQQQMADLQSRELQTDMAARPAPTPAAASGDDLIARLTQLGDLHAKGILTDDEFEQAKAKALSS